VCALFEHAAAVYNALVMRSAGDRLVITLAVASFTKKLTLDKVPDITDTPILDSVYLAPTL